MSAVVSATHSDGIVHGFAAAAQNDVAIGIAGSDKDGRLAVMRVAEKGVRAGGGEHRVNGHLNVARGCVLESDRTRDAGDELAMHLAFGGARADSSPADEAGDVLRRDHVEEFGSRGHAHFGEVNQEMAREAQAVVDFVGAVEMRIVDEALPADGGAGLFKVDAHDDAQVGGEFADGAFEQAGIFAGGIGVVNGAWAGEDEQAVVFFLRMEMISLRAS